jgi:hypothetical protein
MAGGEVFARVALRAGWLAWRPGLRGGVAVSRADGDVVRGSTPVVVSPRGNTPTRSPRLRPSPAHLKDVFHSASHHGLGREAGR